ncbi:DNA topoisomerase III [Ligilactobacillus salivarius]|uniref:toprim domain-containing protein n=1 Tax=Ligilactobacillus salivarius TaxID=1624 RepID=UPI0013DE7726|nr:toprim domain-containing protein [Ligilactobacillus salivarius]QIG36544.1 DNA topoisomerase III [Ligilactobacillus salivarius]
MTTVVLAEKPNQAKSYAQAFDKSERKDGYLVVTDRILSDETFITYGFGHLVDLYKPEDYNEDYKSWDLKQLPIYPNKFLYRVSEGKNKQFKIVKTLLDKADTVIIATDCDREGENIAWSIINQTKINKANKIFKRLWINSLEKEVIKKGFQNLQDDSKYYNYYLEAEARKKSDWLVGMNLTRLYTKLAGGSHPPEYW